MKEGELCKATVLGSSTNGAAFTSSARDAADSSSVDSPEVLRSSDNPTLAAAVDSLWSSGPPYFLALFSNTHRSIAAVDFSYSDLPMHLVHQTL